MSLSKLKKLPLSIPSFREMVTNNYLYVDKTKLIYQLITGAKYYFLSRPRRFGKSLLCSTLAELFAGNRELFQGLWIEQSDWAWKQHPVIYLDLSRIGYENPDILTADLLFLLDNIAKKSDINISQYTTPGAKLQFLIEALSEKERVVILIDEYDRAILKHIDDPEMAKNMRDALASFYGVIKGLNDYIQFVFMTGVSKFSRTSIFSELNNLIDISMDDRYATICGYTNAELTSVFSHYIEQTSNVLKLSSGELVNAITDRYDGYRFSRNSEHVFNPFSVLLFFDKQVFENYWFATGTPTFLIKLLKKQEYPLQVYNEMPATADELGNFDVDFIPLKTILFQAGYVTIKRYDDQTGYYMLGFPNREVESAFTNYLAKYFVAKGQGCYVGWDAV